VKHFVGYKAASIPSIPDPCRLARQVKQFVG